MTGNGLLTLIWTVCICLVPVVAQVMVKFVDRVVRVKEGEQAVLKVQRVGAVSKILNVIVSVSRNCGLQSNRSCI